MLMKRLLDHSLGKIDLSPTQVRALEIVLRKLVPDLASTESKVTHVSYLDALRQLNVGEVSQDPPQEQRNIH